MLINGNRSTGTTVYTDMVVIYLQEWSIHRDRKEGVDARGWGGESEVLRRTEFLLGG